MAAIQKLAARRPVKYRDLGVRVLISMVISYLMTRQGRYEQISVTLSRNGFVSALITGTITAFLIMSLIRALSLKLDKKYPWDGAAVPRLFLQYAIGLGLGLVLAFLIMALHYVYVLDMPFLETGWFERYGATITMLLVLLNNYYLFWYLGVRFDLLNLDRMAEIKPKTIEFSSNIQLVIHDEGINRIYTSEGMEASTLSLEDINKDLDPVLYELFQKKCIIYRPNILDVKPKKTGGWEVHLKIPQSVVVHISERQGSRLQGFLGKKLPAKPEG